MPVVLGAKDGDKGVARLHLAPEVPSWIGRLVLEGVPLMGGRLSIEVEGDRCTVLQLPPGLTVGLEALLD